MDQIAQIASSALTAIHQNIESITHCLANANTPGFKCSRPLFEEQISRVITPAGRSTTSDSTAPSGQLIGTGVKMVANPKNFTSGSQVQTGNPLDWAISGDGLFAVQIPGDANPVYTRAGRFLVDQTGRITDQNGYVLQPEMTIPQGAQSLSVSQDGIVSVVPQGATASEQLGQLQLYYFVNESGLESIGGNNFRETTASGSPIAGNPMQNGLGLIVQNAYEQSNTSVVESMVDMLEAQRVYDMASRALKASDDMQKEIIDVA